MRKDEEGRVLVTKPLELNWTEFVEVQDSAQVLFDVASCNCHNYLCSQCESNERTIWAQIRHILNVGKYIS